MARTLASRPSCPRFNSKHSQKISEEKIIDVVEVNQQHCLETSGQCLENVDRTHLEQASGKLVIQKTKQKQMVSRWRYLY